MRVRNDDDVDGFWWNKNCMRLAADRATALQFNFTFDFHLFFLRARLGSCDCVTVQPSHEFVQTNIVEIQSYQRRNKLKKMPRSIQFFIFSRKLSQYRRWNSLCPFSYFFLAQGIRIRWIWIEGITIGE